MMRKYSAYTEADMHKNQIYSLQDNVVKFYEIFFFESKANP